MHPLMLGHHEALREEALEYFTIRNLFTELLFEGTSTNHDVKLLLDSKLEFSNKSKISFVGDGSITVNCLAAGNFELSLMSTKKNIFQILTSSATKLTTSTFSFRGKSHTVDIIFNPAPSARTYNVNLCTGTGNQDVLKELRPSFIDETSAYYKTSTINFLNTNSMKSSVVMNRATYDNPGSKYALNYLNGNYDVVIEETTVINKNS